ncbi:MAG: general secretion pathway protein GspK [Candidatus Hydrogenedentes bacterium]|nr:general secretion pathway protein GspK [Candidatus Hydrogenedentota bacterium]
MSRVTFWIATPSNWYDGNRRGFVLVIVLWIALGLIAIVLLFGEGMRMEYRAAANSAGGIEADQAMAGVRRYITYSLGNLDAPGTVPDPVTYAVEDVPIGEASYWLLGRADQDQMIAPDTPAYGFIDEASKLNLNAPTTTPEMLVALPNMTQDVVDAILDWKDADSDARPSGAESDYYLLQNPPYNCKNGNFESVEELRLVKGVTTDLLFGEDTNLNGVLDPNENDGAASSPDDDADGKLKRGLLDFVTIYSQEPNTRADGSRRLNVNAIERQQSTGPVTGDVALSVERYLNDTLGARRGTDIVKANGRDLPPRSVLEFYVRAAVTVEEAAKVEDALTASDPSKPIDGHVNVNTAPRETLVSLPGIGEQFADALVSLRKTKTADQLNTVMWITEVVDRANAVAAGPYITTKAYRLSADVAVVAANGRAFRRTWMVFDTSKTPPMVIYSRDRSGLGWPLGSEMRDALDNQQQLVRKGLQ